jgi:hypothetical protein
MRFDVDSLAAEFQPVSITFRGAVFTLGSTIEQVLTAVDLAKKVPDAAPVSEQLAILPAVLAALSPDLGTAVGDGKSLTLPENLVLQKCVEAAMQQIAKVPFRPVE